MSETSETLQLPTNESAIALAGRNEENLKFLCGQTGVQLVLRGRELLVSGQSKAVNRCLRAIQSLEPDWKDGKNLSQADWQMAFHAIDTGRTEEYKDLQRTVLARTRRGEAIRAKTFRQRQYIQAIQKHDIVFCIGPAGTGKTFLAAVLAVQALLNDECERLILTRPAVEAGEKLGFLPGGFTAKGESLSASSLRRIVRIY